MARPVIKSNANIIGINAGVSLVKSQIIKRAIPDLTNDIKSHDSYLGTPVYDSVTIGNINNNSYINIVGENINYSPIRFDDVLIDVSLQKNIVSTAIQGKDGTIKQYISDGDYSILITGKISGRWNGENWEKNGAYYPEQEIKNLVNICKAGYSIPITSAFLNNVFEVNNIVITDYRLTQTEGGRYQQGFELNCLSDKDIILEFTEEEVSNSELLKTILDV